MTRPTIGVCVITHNEAQNIQKCLNSIPNADQKVVVDSGSVDGTEEIAKKCGADVIIRKWNGYSEQKQFALDQMHTDWIIPIDGDEWLTSEVYQEIITLISNGPKFDAYRITGCNIFMNKVLSVGKGLDHSIRLIRNGKGRYDQRVIHETLIVDGTIGHLRHFLIHNSSPTISERIQKIILHTEAEMNYIPAKKISIKDIIIDPLRYFLGYFIKYKTWKDGVEGIIWLLLFAFQSFLRNAKYYEKQMSQTIKS